MRRGAVMRDALASIALGILVPLAVADVLFLCDIGAPAVSVPLPCASAVTDRVLVR